jgi:hypothetical protein
VSLKNKIISVRLGEKSTLELLNISKTSDRSMSQLLRFALTHLSLDAHSIQEFIPETKKDKLAKDPTGFRLSEEDSSKISNLITENPKLKSSDIIRVAIRYWLDNGKPKKEAGYVPSMLGVK